jgi:hypothetical protein
MEWIDKVEPSISKTSLLLLGIEIYASWKLRDPYVGPFRSQISKQVLKDYPRNYSDDIDLDMLFAKISELAEKIDQGHLEIRNMRMKEFEDMFWDI